MSMIAEAALRAARAQSGAAAVLTDADYLSLLMAVRETELGLHRGPLTEKGLASFCYVASVCKAWHDAVNVAVGARIAVRHASMFDDCPLTCTGFSRPAFLTLTLDHEHLLVADQVPTPPFHDLP